jgi:hypothetical protein
MAAHTTHAAAEATGNNGNGNVSQQVVVSTTPYFAPIPDLTSFSTHTPSSYDNTIPVNIRPLSMTKVSSNNNNNNNGSSNNSNGGSLRSLAASRSRSNSGNKNSPHSNDASEEVVVGSGTNGDIAAAGSVPRARVTVSPYYFLDTDPVLPLTLTSVGQLSSNDVSSSATASSTAPTTNGHIAPSGSVPVSSHLRMPRPRPPSVATLPTASSSLAPSSLSSTNGHGGNENGNGSITGTGTSGHTRNDSGSLLSSSVPSTPAGTAAARLTLATNLTSSFPPPPPAPDSPSAAGSALGGVSVRRRPSSLSGGLGPFTPSPTSSSMNVAASSSIVDTSPTQTVATMSSSLLLLSSSVSGGGGRGSLTSDSGLPTDSPPMTSSNTPTRSTGGTSTPQDMGDDRRDGVAIGRSLASLATRWSIGSEPVGTLDYNTPTPPSSSSLTSAGSLPRPESRASIGTSIGPMGMSNNGSGAAIIRDYHQRRWSDGDMDDHGDDELYHDRVTPPLPWQPVSAADMAISMAAMTMTPPPLAAPTRSAERAESPGEELSPRDRASSPYIASFDRPPTPQHVKPTTPPPTSSSTSSSKASSSSLASSNIATSVTSTPPLSRVLPYPSLPSSLSLSGTSSSSSSLPIGVGTGRVMLASVVESSRELSPLQSPLTSPHSVSSPSSTAPSTRSPTPTTIPPNAPNVYNAPRESKVSITAVSMERKRSDDQPGSGSGNNSNHNVTKGGATYIRATSPTFENDESDGKVTELTSAQLSHRSEAMRRGDWNEQFVRALEMNDSVAKQEKLTQLSADFIAICQTYGRIIIGEHFLRREEKSLRKRDLGGFAGGDKFVIRGILFKLARDTPLNRLGNEWKDESNDDDDDDGHHSSHHRHQQQQQQQHHHQHHAPPVRWLYGGKHADYEQANKAAGHELKGALSFFRFHKYGIHVPMQALIDYQGFRYFMMLMAVATILYRLSNSSHSFGCDNK